MYLAFLCRLDISFSVWLVFILVGLIPIFKQKKYIYILYLSLPLLLSLFSYWLFLYFTNAFGGFKESVIDILFFCLNKKNKIYLLSSGLDNYLENLVIVFASFCLQLLAALLLFLGSIISVSIYKKNKTKISNVLLYIMLALVSFRIAFFVFNFMNYTFQDILIQYRLMPIILISGIFWYLFKLFFISDVDSKKYLSLLILFSISFILILRRFLIVSPNHYGFFLSVTSLICYFIFFTDSCFSLFNKLKIGTQAKNYYLFSFFIFFIFLMYPFIDYSYITYRSKNLSVSTDRGAIISFNDDRTRGFWETVNYLRNTPKDCKVVVFPEGIGINFFSYRDNPLRYSSFLPPELAIIKEDKLINQLKSNKINYIVILSRTTFEYDYPFFGIHYGRKIYSWIIKNYQLVKLIGPYPFTSSDYYGIAIFKRT